MTRYNLQPGVASGSDGPSPVGPRRRSGFTLVEVLLALTLTSVVLTLVGRIAVQTVEIHAQAEDYLRLQARQDILFESIAADLRARPSGGRVTVRLDANHRPLLQWTTLVAESGGSLHLARIPATVVYRLVRDGADRLRMVREVRSLLRRTAPKTTLTVGRDLTEVEVERFDGETWSAVIARAASRKKKRPPLALRLSCKWAEHDDAEIRTYLCATEDEIRTARERTK
ncbi:MAG: prepilin-type N-terminal cleavage/methylation domain-containing protein [bacterium]|nr:prepilin-type N-terminal cleavage/methylation domain-containing protein [bacterium]